MELLMNAPAVVPSAPEYLEETGLPEDLVAGLLIKMLHQRGSASGSDLADSLALPFQLLDDLIEQLQDQRLVQVQATKGPTRGEYAFGLTSEGKKRALEELQQSRYVGPAPVPFDDFIRLIELQSIKGARIAEPELRRALDGVVLPDSLLELLGPAVNSGRSVFLYGDSGNGKTLLAKRLAQAFGTSFYVPHSVLLLDGSIMIVYDPVHHGSHATARSGGARNGEGAFTAAARTGNGTGLDTTAIETNVPGVDGPDGEGPEHGHAIAVLHEILRRVPKHDRRYVEARRPVVITGGELSLEQLDLQWDSAGGMYQAPPQLKAAGGVLVIDDLGRQRVQVQDLLNRWGVPLEQRQDHLTLRSGRNIVVPFDCFVVFSTNLEPRSLSDSFMRRIHYKIHVPNPGRAEYEEIFRYCCEERGIRFDAAAVDFIFDEFYANGGVEPRRCHPRDVLDHVRDLAAYRGEPPRLDPELLGLACRSYFLTQS
jgi:hypothetical protein